MVKHWSSTVLKLYKCVWELQFISVFWHAFWSSDFYVYLCSIFLFAFQPCNVFMASNDKQQCCHPKLATVPRLTSSIHLHWETIDIQPQSNLHQWQEICHSWLLTRYHEWQQAPKGHESLPCGRKQVPHFGYAGHKPTYKRGELYFVYYIKILLIILPILERVSWCDCCAWDTFLAVE